MIKFLDLNAHNAHTEIYNEIDKVIKTTSFINGDKVKEFESNFSNYLGLDYFIGVGNGTDAIEIALDSLNLDNNSEIIVQGNTYVATCQSVCRNNLKLITCDVNKDTYQIDINDLINKITCNTRVLIIVHLFGLISNMDIIVDICTKNNIILIEDCAQAHGAEFNGKKVGTFGKLSCFSFYPGKNLGAYGDAGGIGTNDENLYNKILYIRNNGSIIKYQHDYIGRNSRLDTIHAAVLNVKLKYLNENNEKRRKIVNIYNNNLKDIVKVPDVLPNTNPVYHLYVIQSNERNSLQDFLKENKIETIIHYPICICELKGYSNLNYNKNCIELSNKILSLPLYPELKESDIIYICDKIKEFYNNKSQIYKFKEISSSNKGGILNCINELNFDTKRIFYINNFNINDLARGNHANKTCKEFVFVVNGGIKLELINKNNEKRIIYLYKNEGFIINNLEWLIYKAIEDDTTLMVLCNEEFYGNDSDKSIHNFNEFINKKYIYYDELKNKSGKRYLEASMNMDKYSTHSPSCTELENVLNKLNNIKQITNNDSIIDIGCGEGYCFDIFSKFKFGKIDGIEADKDTYNKCIQKLDMIKTYLVNINIKLLTAQEFKEYDNYNYFYLYNPFNSEIFENFIKNIKLTDTIIIYYNIHNEEEVILRKYNFILQFSNIGETLREYKVYKLIN